MSKLDASEFPRTEGSARANWDRSDDILDGLFTHNQVLAEAHWAAVAGSLTKYAIQHHPFKP